MRPDPQTHHTPLLRPGANCWRLTHCERLKLFLSTADYFAALYDALAAARKSVFILGWDIDSRLRLLRDGAPRDLPIEIGPLLNALVERRPELEVRILLWDYHLIYALEREAQAVSRLRRGGHPRLHVRLDAQHPSCASHHQKLVVIDDRLAFVGGVDLSKRRWDTQARHWQDPRRVDPDGVAYAPFHDIMALVDGDTARSLAHLARDRWRVATRQRLRPVRALRDPWPSDLKPDFTGCHLAIARTRPSFRGRREVREVERLFLDSIAAAQRWIYIESQYLTAASITEALAGRLREPGGPDVIIVLPRETGAWLEQNTMDVLRNQVLRTLETADVHGRLRVYYPNVPGPEDQPVYVHAKLMIVDRLLLRLGSANLNNRSMGQDSECDIALEADCRESRRLVYTTLLRLLGNHLSLTPAAVAAALAEHGSLAQALDALSQGRRRLLPLRHDPGALDALVPALSLVDRERSMDPASLLRKLLPAGWPGRMRRYRWLAGTALIVALGVIWGWADWRLPPPARLHDLIAELGANPLALLWIIAGASGLGRHEAPVWAEGRRRQAVAKHHQRTGRHGLPDLVGR